MAGGEETAEAQGTLPRVGKGTLVHSPDGITAYRTRMSTIRGDYRDEQGNNRNRLRPWEKEDIVPRPEDILQERLYCVQWIRETEEAGPGGIPIPGRDGGGSGTGTPGDGVRPRPSGGLGGGRPAART